MSRNCLFCKIAEKALDARIVYENSKVIAFEDVNPQAPVHVLVIPKKHVGSAAEVLEGEVWADLMGAATEVARELDLGDGGYRLVINCGAQAGQTIPHLHVHLLADDCSAGHQVSQCGWHRKGGSCMTTIIRKDNESLEDALRRFKREVSKVGTLREARKREHYEKPSEVKKAKRAEAARKRRSRSRG